MNLLTAKPSAHMLTLTFVYIQLLEYGPSIVPMYVPAYFPPGKRRCYFF